MTLSQLWDRAWHPLRRRLASATLRALYARRPPRVVLVVCYGNLCRSPFAERLLARALDGKDVSVRSAGLGAIRVPPPPAALLAADRRGASIAGHVSTPVTHAMVADADLVITMDARQSRTLTDVFGVSPRRILVLGDCDPEPVSRRGIPDPIAGTSADFDASYARIERCVAALARILGGLGGLQSGSTASATASGPADASGAGLNSRASIETPERANEATKSQASAIAGIQSSIVNSS